MTLGQITYTAADIATYVKRQFGDESAVQITDLDIYRWINAAQLELISQIAPTKARGTTDVVSGQRDYDLTGLNIFQIESLHLNGSLLENMPFQEAERKIIDTGGYSTVTGTPVFWYEYAGVISFYPVPDQSAVGGLEIYYTKTATKVTTGTDFLSVPDKFFDAIVSWVMSKAFELDEEFDQAANQRTNFNNKIMEQNGEERTAANATYPTITFIED